MKPATTKTERPPSTRLRKPVFEGFLILGLLSALGPGATAAVYYVKESSAGLNNGFSWSDAYTNLHFAINISVYGDEIRVAAGTYKPATVADRVAAFRLRNGIKVYGGYAGIGADRDPTRYPTILSGEIGVPGPADNSYSVVIANVTNHNTVLDGFTIAAGNADAGYGGGLVIPPGGSPLIANCIFLTNRATSGAGISLGETSRALISNCTFTGNATYTGPYSGGGGVYIAPGGTPTVVNCVFENNSAQIAGGGGGGIYSEGSLRLVNCVFRNNVHTVAGLGSAVMNYGNLTVEGCTFVRNRAMQGGTVFSQYGSATFNNCSFLGNDVSPGGSWGGLESLNPVFLTNCVFIGNVGGLYAASGTAVNCTLTAHNVSGGPAVLAVGGIINIKNSILWGNNGGNIVIGGQGSAAVSYSCVQGGYAGTNNVNVDPKFLDANGADNLFGTLDDDVRLQPDSPVVDAGSNIAIGAVTHDRAGRTRVLDGNSDGSFVVDLGAYEYALLLEARRTANSLVLSWPTAATGFVVQASADLTQSTNWLRVAASPTNDNNQSVLTLDLGSGNQFYRLIKVP